MIRRRLTQEERKKETRRLLIQSAEETFARWGFHGASLEKIADNAGFSKGALYAHFKSKEELFLVILEERMQAHVDRIREAMQEHRSPDGLLAAMNARFEAMRASDRTGSMLRLEFLLHAMREEPVRHQWSERMREAVQQLADLLDSWGKETRQVSSLTAEELAWVLLALENGVAILSYVEEERVPSGLYGKALRVLLALEERDNACGREQSG
ncbi:TetR family transcriptional regulator [Paenibacillus sp. J31TS4]|uniref:TetR/AcrR family transcriptional regulator n=1 Tax=Paenibacillus sp. J31TS4 TaxID=2807195 RepID=UPI001B1B8AA3|nr:TetR/AcrR family transcriptional regulator [Paenibacillus sp. J31TS4]GIP41412.1 TetR family transcriptional regulator [Paenibacillus sp. J31TS4]